MRMPMSTIWYSVPSTVTRPSRAFAVIVRAGSSRRCPFPFVPSDE
jgi:hypothetical protein